MSAVAEVYANCANSTMYIDGNLFAVEKGGFKVPAITDEMTNSGYYEDVATIGKATFSLTVAGKLAGNLGLVSGNVYSCWINYNSTGTTPIAGNPSFKGNVRISLDDLPTLDRKAGMHLSVSGTSQGSFVYAI